ncbi:hypothetical protein [Micromonospora sp. 050-3]
MADAEDKIEEAIHTVGLSTRSNPQPRRTLCGIVDLDTVQIAAVLRAAQ